MLKNVLFSDFEVLEIHQQVKRGKYQQDATSRIETLNTEKQEFPERIETQNSDSRNTMHSNTT